MSTEELSTSDSEAAFAGAGERWAPVGAVASPEDESGKGNAVEPRRKGSAASGETEMAARLRKLEDEQGLLNSSLLALTSHFAQVQFRLKQIVHAQTDEKERMLVELEEFAFKGCPHVVGCRPQDTQQLENAVSSPSRPRLVRLGRSKNVNNGSSSVSRKIMSTQTLNFLRLCDYASYKLSIVCRKIGYVRPPQNRPQTDTNLGLHQRQYTVFHQ